MDLTRGPKMDMDQRRGEAADALEKVSEGLNELHNLGYSYKGTNSGLSFSYPAEAAAEDLLDYRMMVRVHTNSGGWYWDYV